MPIGPELEQVGVDTVAALDAVVAAGVALARRDRGHAHDAVAGLTADTLEAAA
jgi:hypothetical protein